MNDGRNYASYQPEAIVNERIQVRNNINTLEISSFLLIMLEV